MIPSLLVWSISIPVVLGCRSLLRQFARRQGWYNQKVLVIGRATDARRIVSRIHRHPEWGLSVAEEVDVGDDAYSEGSSNGQPSRRLDGANADELHELARDSGVSRVMFATPPGQLDARTDLTRSFIESGMQVDFVPGEAEVLRSGAVISHLEGLPLMSMPGARLPRSLDVLKRAVDLVVAIPVLILVSPIIAYSAVRIRFDSPGPVFYRQARAGRDGRQFEFLKLRTMSVDAEDRLDQVASLSLHGEGGREGIFKAVDDPRITAAGRRLRRRSLDELPQLWNVVRGDMSLVGPRPLPVHEDERVAGHYEIRRHVRPGMTGPWQVSGRSDIPFHDMLRLDYSYVLNWSLSADLKLMVQTVDAVLRGRGAY
jgi:exopolysaccharide biosynthesis polyprenyl glycosylphosphotransferase